jgi:hypothetical protein
MEKAVNAEEDNDAKITEGESATEKEEFFVPNSKRRKSKPHLKERK